MTESPLIQCQRQSLRDLLRLCAETMVEATRIEEDFQARTESGKASFHKLREQLIQQFHAEKERAELKYSQARQVVLDRYAAERGLAEEEYTQAKDRAQAEYAAKKHKIVSDFKESRWTIGAMYEAAKTSADNQNQEAQRRATSAMVQIQAVRGEAQAIADKWELPVPEGLEENSAAAQAAPSEPSDRLEEALASAGDDLGYLRGLFIPKILKGRRLPALFLVLGLAAAAPAFFIHAWYYWLGASIGGTLVLVIFARSALTRAAREQVWGLYEPLCRTLAEGEVACQQLRDQAIVTHKRLSREARTRRDTEWQQAQAKYRHSRAESKQRRETIIGQALEKYRGLRAQLKQRRNDDLVKSEAINDRFQNETKPRYDADLHDLHDQYYSEEAKTETEYGEQWKALVERWRKGMSTAYDAAMQTSTQSQHLFPDWSDPGWNVWSPAGDIPPGVRFGEFQVDLLEIPGGLPPDERLTLPIPPSFALPALLSFPRHCSVLLKASDVGRAQAVQLVQAIMMRFLTSVPPGKVRFTIIDPVGLGENFATFMHLADYDEALVSSKIWTELPHIEQRLADLTAHMEVVIQKYLRNQFQTIEEYNAMAGEVAEPFRVLVVANFPTGFSVDAARRLVSIVSSGARCGVYTLISVDMKQPVPQGFNLKDLEQHALNLVWKDQRFQWKDGDFGCYPLQLDAPPEADFCTRILKLVGSRAKEANRVEVPFDFVAPPPEQWWTGDSSLGLQVPLGRAGATKRQLLRLGQGTAQHILVAGKTGSGKSTLLHVLITNIALLYRPDEVELFLIDFKKGVEFKAYATQALPHARVIAIESEREFGLSVLQRLDAELKQRGDLFRQLGVQDLNGYRQANGSTPLPRILLIVDEFQEFFVEDDRIAQDAAQLLDRLVRQGRAFGLHVMLGSQTLGGAYTLARSTVDQMAVRIALQCSETDAHLILSEDNSAARLLSRPGEAIYNDANGLVEGNNPFQIVWLDDDRRETLLQQVQQLAVQHNHQLLAGSQIVFEGNAPADVRKNRLLAELLQAPAWPQPSRATQAWLGEAIAIKDPTAATFRRQGGSNLLVIGQRDDEALGMLATGLVCLAAQHMPGKNHAGPGARFYVLDGTSADSTHPGVFDRLAQVLPHPLRIVHWRGVSEVLGELTAELERRQQNHDAEASSVYLFIHGLQRFRDLRRAEDDFAFGGRPEEPPNPAKQLSSLLREGAVLGMHTLMWCDNLNNLNRALDRQSQREFEMRVLFQMSAADSSTLIDTPLATKLGLHRALYHSEEEGRIEKFRPYSVPPETWLESVRDWFSHRFAGVTV